MDLRNVERKLHALADRWRAIHGLTFLGSAYYHDMVHVVVKLGPSVKEEALVESFSQGLQGKRFNPFYPSSFPKEEAEEQMKDYYIKGQQAREQYPSLAELFDGKIL